MLVCGVALMAGALTSSDAQAQTQPQCSGGTGFPLPPSTLNTVTSAISTVNTAFLINGSPFVSESPVTGPDQQSGGVWIRGIGGTVDTQANSTITGTAGFFGVPQAVNASCQTKVTQDFGGFQAGQDIAILNNDNTGMNWHFGVLAGYVGTNFHDDTSGGTLRGNFEVPFVGLYTTFSKGNFFADAQTRFDYYQGELSDPANGVSNERLDARGVSVTANMGDHFALGGNWTAEPSVGGIYSQTTVDPFSAAGNDLPTFPGGVFTPPAGTLAPGQVQIHDIESELGRASIKVGTSTELNGIVAYPFASASVYHEFAGNVTASISNGSGAFFTGMPIAETQTVGRVGTYGQFSVGSAFQLPNTGWLSYIRADYRTGENIQGITLNAGLRYQLNPDTGSLKDDGGLKDAPAPEYSWTGPYAGVSAGGTWGTTYWPQGPFPDRMDNAGVLGGGQIGYNYQVGHFVWGAEGFYGASNARGGRGSPDCSIDNELVSCNDDVNALGTVTARLGYTYGRALFYGKGGWAFGQVKAGMISNNAAYAAASVTSPGVIVPGSSTNWESGWTVGGGMEFALTDRWSARAEYMHYEFPEKTFTIDGYGDQSDIRVKGDSVMIGVNYHLGAIGITAEPLK